MANQEKQSSAKEIFFEALDKLRPDERASYLAEACGADTPLRRKVDELLANHFDPGSFMNQPAADAATILGHLAEYFGKEQQDDKPHDDRHM